MVIINQNQQNKYTSFTDGNGEYHNIYYRKGDAVPSHRNNLYLIHVSNSTLNSEHAILKMTVFHTKYHHCIQRDLTEINKFNNLEEEKVGLLFQDL